MKQMYFVHLGNEEYIYRKTRCYPPCPKIEQNKKKKVADSNVPKFYIYIINTNLITFEYNQ